MVVIRGATTIESDSKENIQTAVKELLEQIELANRISRGEMTSIVFSSTADIHSYYPAKAAREAGFETSALFSAMEPEIDGALPLCIRVMIFVEKNIAPKHVYLRGARVLRKDISSKFNVAIDGPAGSGKSTVAKLLARDYNILYLDTGAMYRACALYVMRQGIAPENEVKVCEACESLDLRIEYQDGTQKTILNGEDVSEKIRTNDISMAASTVSRYPYVRTKLVEKQREIAREMSCVLDGRDIGSYVLPDAEFKFFLTASSQVRAERRYAELKQRGTALSLEQIKADIEARDLQDSTRKFAPLKQADDALLIDTSLMSIEEVLAQMKRTIQEKI